MMDPYVSLPVEIPSGNTYIDDVGYFAPGRGSVEVGRLLFGAERGKGFEVPYVELFRVARP